MTTNHLSLAYAAVLAHNAVQEQELAELREQRDRALALHGPTGCAYRCNTCNQPWPCPTARELGASGPPDTA